MARTYRNEPSSGAYMRKPRHIRAMREMLRAEDDGYHENRKALPPTDREDYIVSYYRGQAWHRQYKS